MRGERTGKPQISLGGHALFRKRDHVFHIVEWVNGFTNPACTFLPRGGTSMVVYKYIWYLYYIGNRGTRRISMALSIPMQQPARLLHRLLQRDSSLALHDVSTRSDRRFQQNGRPKIANRIDKYYRFKDD